MVSAGKTSEYFNTAHKNVHLESIYSLLYFSEIKIMRCKCRHKIVHLHVHGSRQLHHMYFLTSLIESPPRFTTKLWHLLGFGFIFNFPVLSSTFSSTCSPYLNKFFFSLFTNEPTCSLECAVIFGRGHQGPTGQKHVVLSLR